jgi:hypothetical protein
VEVVDAEELAEEAPESLVQIGGHVFRDVARKPSGVPDGEWPEASWQYQLAAWLYGKLLERGSSHVETLQAKGKREQALQRWARHLDDPVRLDGLAPENLALLLRWLLGSWWVSSGNFHSPNKLREKSGEVYRWQQWLDAAKAAHREQQERTERRPRNSGADPSVFDSLRSQARGGQ